MIANFRRAWPDELELLQRRFRLPVALDENISWSVACDTSPRERPLGVVVIAQALNEAGTVARAALFWRMLPAYQKSEIERDLLLFALSETADDGVHSLFSFAALPATSPASKMLQSLGFTVTEQTDEFEAPFSAVWERCQRVYRLLERRKAIPPDAHIGPFEKKLLPDIRAIFQNTRIMGSLEFDARMSPFHDEPIDLERSTAILQNDQLIGAMLVSPSKLGHVYTVPARWVAKGHRHSWVNAVLIHNSVRQGVPLALDRVRFVANRENHKETAALAANLGGLQVRSLQRFGINLVGGQFP
tara:strand:- start:25125 stop:26030 length:906 start_codon:yes stop_codon:yes gene_type:complete